MLNDNKLMMGLEERTGQGVLVGIIDSGIDINNANLMEHCKSGGTVIEHDNRQQYISGEYADIMGHGTAVASIIVKKASRVDLFIVKIFHDSMICSCEQLILAIQKCIEVGCNVINISAGLINSEPELIKVTKAAAQKCYLVCACSNQKGINFYPAAYPWCFGVASGNCRKKFDYYYDEDNEIQFIARGDQQRLIWLFGTQVFMGGSSFAVAHVSAIIALLLEEDLNMSRDILSARLRTFSMQEPPKIVHVINDSYSSPYILSEHDKNNLREEFFFRSVYKFNRVAIKGKQARFFESIKENLNYEIVDISEEFILKNEKEFDAVILACEDEDIKEQLSFEDQLINLGKRVYYFTPDYVRKDIRLKKISVYPNLVREPAIEYDSIYKLIEKYPYVAKHGVRCPIAGFIAADDSPEVHACFVKLCFALRRRGYKIGIFDGTADSLLYGGDISFPCNAQSKIQTDFSHYVPLIRSLMQIADISGDYDLIMVYNTSRLKQNGDVNATMRFIAFLIGALLEGYFFLGKPGEKEIELINSITRASLIQLIEEPYQSERKVSKSIDFLINYFK